jgi:plastocyanin
VVSDLVTFVAAASAARGDRAERLGYAHGTVAHAAAKTRRAISHRVFDLMRRLTERPPGHYTRSRNGRGLLASAETNPNKEGHMGSKLAKMVAAAAFVIAGTGASLEARAAETRKEVKVAVDRGYQPNLIEVKEGELVRLTFLRTDYTPCTREVVFPELGIRKELPTNKAVVIELPALKAGEYEFRCGMNMVRGTIVVRPRG